MDIVHEMLTRFYESAVYDVLYTYPDLQAYRKDRFTGWVAPARRDRAGAVLEHARRPTRSSSRSAADARTRRRR